MSSFNHIPNEIMLIQTSSSTIKTILQWLRSNHNVQPRAYMSDCDKAITKAIAETYSTSIKPPKHYWCAVHVIKAARRCAGEYVSLPKHITKQKITHPHVTGSRRRRQGIAPRLCGSRLLTYTTRGIFSFCRKMDSKTPQIRRVCTHTMGQDD